MKGYTSINSENTLTEIKELFYHQQEREDKLREQCYLQMYIIPPDPPFYKSLITSYQTYLNTNYYLTTHMEARTYDEFMEVSYDQSNVGNDILFEGSTYNLIEYGKSPRTPKWSLIVGNHTLIITNIK